MGPHDGIRFLLIEIPFSSGIFFPDWKMDVLYSVGFYCSFTFSHLVLFPFLGGRILWSFFGFSLDLAWRKAVKILVIIPLNNARRGKYYSRREREPWSAYI